MDYAFDRFLRFDELTRWLEDTCAAHPGIASLQQYGTSHEGRALWLVTITDSSTGAHDTKPAMWVDANIHSVEVTGSVAALHLIDRLVTGFASGDPVIVDGNAVGTITSVSGTTALALVKRGVDVPAAG